MKRWLPAGLLVLASCGSSASVATTVFRPSPSDPGVVVANVATSYCLAHWTEAQVRAALPELVAGGKIRAGDEEQLLFAFRMCEG